MIENQDSLIEIAIKEMSKKRRPRTLSSIAKDVFEIKGLTKEEAEAALPQFQIDFMLCGNFIGIENDDKKGEKLWDLKYRQESKYLDKEGVYESKDYDDDDAEAKANELTADNYPIENDDNLEGTFAAEDDEDDDDDEEEKDDIEEELLLYEEDDEDDDESNQY